MTERASTARRNVAAENRSLDKLAILFESKPYFLQLLTKLNVNSCLVYIIIIIILDTSAAGYKIDIT